jgi:predicted nucleic acid-binding protein
MVILFDTSAIAKRYRDEPGRDQVEHWLSLADDVMMAAHCKVEVASSLCRDHLNGLTTDAQLAIDLDFVDKDFDDFSIVSLDRRIEKLAITAMTGNRLRAMDALHIATAQAAYVDLFVTADKAQARAAQAMLLATHLIEVV